MTTVGIPREVKDNEYRVAITPAGVNELVLNSWAALYGPAKLPPAIVDKLNKGVTQIKQTPAVKQQLSTLGAIPVDMTPEELGAFLKRELEKWTKVIRAGGITAE